MQRRFALFDKGMTDELFPDLPWATKEDGTERRIGFELEFAGLTVAETADAIVESLGGRVEVATRFERFVHETTIGKIRIELDTSYLKHEKYRATLEGLGIDAKGIRWVEDVVESVAQRFVPCEVVTDPVPLSKIGHLETLREALRQKQATGTNARLRYAFGLHINLEAASLGAGHLHAVLAAFLLLYEWIVDTSSIDWSRRLTPFIDPFPNDYVERVVHPDYEPTLGALIDDYLEANPTRNRALDMLPIFLEADRDRVRKVVDDPLVVARPAFHYRLPDCRIDEPEWRIADAVAPWAEVEALAANPERRRRLGQSYLRTNEHAVLGRRKAWIAFVKEEMKDHGATI